MYQRLNPHVQDVHMWKPTLCLLFFHSIKNPVAQIYLDRTLERCRSLVRSCDVSRTNLVPLHRDESASVFWEDKFVPRDYYNVKNTIYDVGFRSGQLDMWIFSLRTLRPQSDK